MRLPQRLYLRIYLAMLAALVISALIIGVVWRHTFEGGFLRGQFAALAADIAAEVLPDGRAGTQPVQRALDKWHRRSHTSLALYDPARRLIAAAGSGAPPLPPQQTESGWFPMRGGPPAIALQLSDGRWLVAQHDRRLHKRPMGFVLSLVLIALVLGLLAYPLARRLTRRLERLQKSVEQLGDGDLSARAPVRGHDEIAALARSFNQSAERLESLVRTQKSLLANASHELRSPLARLRMTAEALHDKADPTQRVHLQQDIAELDQLIEELLLASRLEAAVTGTAKQEEIDLAGLVAEECARTGADLEAVAVSVNGDATLLRRMIRNLLDNARRHGRGTPVRVDLTRDSDGVRLRVCDRGPGIPEAERERIFEPFHRLPGLREGEGGAGLGLSIVRQIARQHRGDVQCEAHTGDGACFQVRLPAAQRVP